MSRAKPRMILRRMDMARPLFCLVYCPTARCLATVTRRKSSGQKGNGDRSILPGQRLHECNEVGGLDGGKGEVRHLRRQRGPPFEAAVVMGDHGIQRGDRSVVHVGCAL